MDYVLLDKQGQRVGLPISYRDDRTQDLLRHAEEQLGRAEIYRRSGIQFLPFNTLYQLRAWWSSSRSWSVRPRMPC